MAQAQHLPIYKASYDLCLYFEQIVRSFSRYHKYSIGQDLRDGARAQERKRTFLALQEELRAHTYRPGRSICGYAVVEAREVELFRRACAARQVVAVWIPDKACSTIAVRRALKRPAEGKEAR